MHRLLHRDARESKQLKKKKKKKKKKKQKLVNSPDLSERRHVKRDASLSLDLVQNVVHDVERHHHRVHLDHRLFGQLRVDCFGNHSAAAVHHAIHGPHNRVAQYLELGRKRPVDERGRKPPAQTNERQHTRTHPDDRQTHKKRGKKKKKKKKKQNKTRFRGAPMHPVLLLLATCLCLAEPRSRGARPPAETSSAGAFASVAAPPTSPGWAFQFTLTFNGSHTAVGAEYFSVAEQVVRRDWAQGNAVFDGSPFVPTAGGTEFLQLASYTHHVLQVAEGDWSCVESFANAAYTPIPVPEYLTGAISLGNTTISDVPCQLWQGNSLARPGPGCPADPLSWKACVTERDALVQLETTCFTLRAFDWRAPPAKMTGAARGPFSVPLECPYDTPPGIMGYLFSLGFLLFLFASLLTVKRGKDGRAKTT
jgi:hypothetical protein